MDAAWQQEASARVDHAHMMRDLVLPDRIHDFSHDNERLTRSLDKAEPRSSSSLCTTTPTSRARSRSEPFTYMDLLLAETQRLLSFDTRELAFANSPGAAGTGTGSGH